MRIRSFVSRAVGILSSIAALTLFGVPAIADVNSRLEQTIDAASVPLASAVEQAMALTPGVPVAEAKLGIRATVTDWPVVLMDPASNTIYEKRFSIVNGSLVFDKTFVRDSLTNRQAMWAQAVTMPVTLLEAIGIASAQAEGNKVYEVKFAYAKDDQATPLWQTRVLTPDYLLVMYDIDASTGAVLQADVLEGGRRAEVLIANLTLTDAIDLAELTLPGTTPLAADLVTRYARVYWSVWSEDDLTGLRYQIVINPIRGDVISIDVLGATASGKTKEPAASQIIEGLTLSLSDAVDAAKAVVGQGWAFAAWATGRDDQVTYTVRFLQGLNTIVTVRVNAFTGEVTGY